MLMMTKMRRTCAGSAEILGMRTIRLGIRALVAGASSLFTRIVSFSGLITATLVNARFCYFSSLLLIVGILDRNMSRILQISNSY